MSTSNLSMEAQLKAKENELQTALKQCEEYKDRFEENEEYVIELENDNKYKEKEIESMTKKIELNCRKLEENKKEINQLTIIMEREKQRAEKKTEEYNTLKSQFVALEQYAESLDNQLRQSTFETEDIKDKFDKLEEVFIVQRETASEALTLKDEELERLRQESLDFRTEINVLKSQLSSLLEKTQENKDSKPFAIKQNTTPKKELNSERSLRSLYLMSLFKMTSNYKTAENEPVSVPVVLVPGQEHPRSAEYYKLIRSQSVQKPQAYRINTRRKTVNQDFRASNMKPKQLYEEFVSSRVINREITQEINGVFQKIKLEIENAVNNKVEIGKLAARIKSEEKTKIKLKKKIDCLLQELSDQKTLNVKITKELADLKSYINKNYINQGNAEIDDLEISGKELKEIEQKDSAIKSIDETLLELERELQELRSPNTSISISSFSPSEVKTKKIHPTIQINTSDQFLSLNPVDTPKFERETRFQKTPRSKQGFEITEMNSDSPTLETRMETNEFVGSRSINSSLSPANKSSQRVASYLYVQGLLSQFPDFLKLNGKQIEMLLDSNSKLNIKKNKSQLTQIQASFDEILKNSRDLKNQVIKNISCQEDISSLNKNLLFLIYGKQSCHQSKIQHELLRGLIENFKLTYKDSRFQGRKHQIIITESLDEVQYSNLTERRLNQSKQFTLGELEESSDALDFLAKSENEGKNQTVIVEFIIKETAKISFAKQNPWTGPFKLRAVITKISDVKDVEILKRQFAANPRASFEVSGTEKQSKNLSSLKSFEKHVIVSISPKTESSETLFELISSVEKISCSLTEENILILPFSSSDSEKSMEEIEISAEDQVLNKKDNNVLAASVANC